MAHSSTVASITTSDEVNYFYKDEYGKIHRVVKQIEIKQEPIGNSSTNAVHSTDAGGNVGTLTQMNKNAPQFVRIQNSYNVQLDDNTSTTTYTLMAPQGNCSKSNCTTTNNMQRHQQQQRACEGSNNIKYVPINNCNNRQQQPHLEHTQNVTKTEERFTKYTQPQIVSNTKSSAKSKLHSTVHQNASVVQRKRKPEKAGKGLRHFSLKVCEKVKVKGTTTYNEVADELVAEEIQNQTFDSSNCDQKNIRRRVYDALNVLMALQIISKDKKEIRWIGLPTNTVEECTILEEENEERRERIKQKHEQLRELLLQLVSFKSLIERNKDAERQGVIPTPNSSIQLPFIIVNTHKSTKINCSVTNDKSEYIFKFDDKFEMHDDAEVLKRMGLLFGLDKGQCSYEDIERAKSLVPPNFEKYIEVYGSGKGNVEDGGDASYGSEDEMPSYDFTELTNDSSRYGFIHATNDDLTLTTPSLTASQELPLMAGSSGRGGGGRVAIGENEEFANNSDID